MRGLLEKIQSSPWLKNTLLLAVLVGGCAGAFWFGQRQGRTSPRPGDLVGPDGLTKTDYDGRVVAYLYADQPISRAELGEYLIARFGAERLDFLVNRKIVEMEAKKHNVHISDAEVEARFKRDLHSFSQPLSVNDFVNTVLKRFNKNLYEWKEDVIRPKLMMEKIVESRVVINDKDLQEGFEARFGPKVDCRMIVFDKSDMTIVQKIFATASKGRTDFLEMAKKQFIPNLAQMEGRVPPIHKHFGDPALEEAAFALQEGQISKLVTLKDGTYVMLLCEKRIPADLGVTLDKVRIKLSEEMRELRVAQRIPEEFNEMRKRANPWLLLNAGGQQQVVPTQSSPTVTGTPVSRTQLPEPANVPPAPKPGDAAPRKEQPAAPTPNSGTPKIDLPPPAALEPAPIPAKTPAPAPKETGSPAPAPAPTPPNPSPIVTPPLSVPPPAPVPMKK